MNDLDNEYVQKATDSLINFETVKYFNAENHEETRYFEALAKYRVQNIVVTKSLAVLNMSQVMCVCLGLFFNMFYASIQSF